MLDEQLIHLSWFVDAADASPTRPQVEAHRMLSKRIEEQLSKWDGVLSQDLLNLNRLAEEQKIPLRDSWGGQ